MAGSEDSRRSQGPRGTSRGATGSASPRTGGGRRPHQRESREQQWIYLGAATVLGIVAVVVVVGLLVTWYLPPRAHVLTVGDRDFNAVQVADRALYLANAGNGNAQRTPAAEGISSLTQQQILLQVGPTLVEEVTDLEVRDAIATRLGLEEGFTDLEYGDALGGFLSASDLGRADFEGIIRAGLYEDRVSETLVAALPEAGDQFHLLAIRTNDRAKAQAVTDAVRGGSEFEAAAEEAGVLESNGEVIDLGWFAPSAVGDRLQDVLVDMQTGDVSDPVNDASNVGFEVFYVDSRTLDEPYEDSVRDQLGALALETFFTDQEGVLGVEEDLSDSERDWIQRRVVDALIASSGG